MKPTEEDMARDLAADLAKIDEYEPAWRTPLLWGRRTRYAWPDYAAFLNQLPLVASAAIRRALAAEAEVERLEASIRQGAPGLRPMVLTEEEAKAMSDHIAHGGPRLRIEPRLIGTGERYECPGYERGGTLDPCCERAGEYNGYGSDGPLKFRCPKGCGCHD